MCEVEHFQWGDVFVYNFAGILNPNNKTVLQNGIIVHGAMSLVNDQIKTVAEGVLRVCIPCTRIMNKNYYERENFENFITFVLGRFLFQK